MTSEVFLRKLQRQGFRRSDRPEHSVRSGQPLALAKGVLRGLHYQLENTQGKLVRVTAGEVLDVAVDIRRSSPHFGKWVAVRLSADNHRQLWVPEGFAHGFVVLSEFAEFLYKTTDYYTPSAERSIRWDDPDLGIDWQLDEAPKLSGKDAAASFFKDADVFS